MKNIRYENAGCARKHFTLNQTNLKVNNYIFGVR